MTSKKANVTIIDWFEIIINGFLGFFFLFYIGKFGVSNLIFESEDKWKIIFNIGIWYVLVMYCFDKFFDRLPSKKEINNEAQVRK